jgi:hypothetical protein
MSHRIAQTGKRSFRRGRRPVLSARCTRYSFIFSASASMFSFDASQPGCVRSITCWPCFRRQSTQQPRKCTATEIVHSNRDSAQQPRFFFGYTFPSAEVNFYTDPMPLIYCPPKPPYPPCCPSPTLACRVQRLAP